MCNDTSLDNGADLAKFERYFKENVSETDFSKMMDTPGSDESSVVFAFFDAWGLALRGGLGLVAAVESGGFVRSDGVDGFF